MSVTSFRHRDRRAATARGIRCHRCLALAWLACVLGIAACTSGIPVERAVSDADARLTAQVKVALVDDPTLAAAAIDVESRSGRVTLSGFVDSDAQRRRARAVAATVTGVREVDVRLLLR